MRGALPSRRDLLGGGLGALLAASACRATKRREIAGGIADTHVAVGHRLRRAGLPPATGEVRRVPIAICGGGVAGLAAAWRLARAGEEDFVLFELGSEVGGTSRGGRTAGLAHPWGAHYLPLPRAEQRALVAFLTDAGILARSAEGALTVPDETLVRAPQERLCCLGFWEEGLWPRAGQGAQDLRELETFEALVRDAIAVDDGGRRHFDLPVEQSSRARRSLDRTSALEWAETHGLQGERMRWYLEYATRDDFGCALEETSAWALLHYFASRADLESGQTGEYLTWPDGNAFLVRQLAQGLEERIRSGRMVTGVRVVTGGAEVSVYDAPRDRLETWRAEEVVLATPQFVNRRILALDPEAGARAEFRYAPWVVANLHLDAHPEERGFPRAWDNVFWESTSLGYVDATHQLDRATERDSLWTWYLALTGSGEAGERERLLATPWEEWRDLILADLRPAHPDIDECVTRIEVWRWGHGMVKPVTGFLWSGWRERAAQPFGPLHFANSDLSGMALFEEAHWQGVRAAEEVLQARGREFESLL